MKKLLGTLFIIGMYTCWGCSGNKQAAVQTAADGAPDKKGKNPIPPCITKMIDSAKALVGSGQEITEIRRYIYQGAKVYLVTAPCCDQFNPVYDSACNFLFAPSGGFTGKGDRSNPDFFTIAKEDSLIWKAGK